MDKKPLIGVSICAVVLLVLGSLTNVVGYQSVKLTENHAPIAPYITGPRNLKIGIDYLFRFVTTDPDGDNISYYVDWGDGTNSGWFGPYYSGQEIKLVHTWSEKGNYIRAKARDYPYEDESNWTYYLIRWSYSAIPRINYQNIINDEVNQKELLFQSILDIANNKEIQRIILKSQMSGGIFPNSDVKFSITKTQLKQMFFIGLLLSKIISKSRIQSMVQKYQLINPDLQQEINAVIEKDTTLNLEIIQLQNSECDCENENTTRLWNFPIICAILGIVFYIAINMPSPAPVPILFHIVNFMGKLFGCSWVW
jgi:hypothetical protein